MSDEKTDELIHLTIDDIPVAVPPGTLVWAAAQQAGIEIPIYCYHPKMPPLGACRMCFVEIEKLPKPPQTACTTPVSEGMVVHTKTEKVLKARKGTLEFLLINHQEFQSALARFENLFSFGMHNHAFADWCCASCLRRFRQFLNFDK